MFEIGSNKQYVVQLLAARGRDPLWLQYRVMGMCIS